MTGFYGIFKRDTPCHVADTSGREPLSDAWFSLRRPYPRLHIRLRHHKISGAKLHILGLLGISFRSSSPSLLVRRSTHRYRAKKTGGEQAGYRLLSYHHAGIEHRFDSRHLRIDRPYYDGLQAACRIHHRLCRRLLRNNLR